MVVGVDVSGFGAGFQTWAAIMGFRAASIGGNAGASAREGPVSGGRRSKPTSSSPGAVARSTRACCNITEGVMLGLTSRQRQGRGRPVKSYEVQIAIDATPARVWQVLTREMPRNPVPFGILHFDGVIAPGARIVLRSQAAPGRAFALTVAVLDAPNRMVWTGGMPLGLFTGTRTFTVTADAGGSVFDMHEAFSGPLAGPITRSMPDLTPSVTTFAQALKQGAEAR